ncbi:carbohydrate binding domain-containing protein [Cohnella cellulosilytica]|uniref:Carbohydrate binding domain-containing protein n=1 Tax=Cohnella cellulosilytica TaxID=986710 RepID=A0ABW2F905_9BACL
MRRNVSLLLAFMMLIGALQPAAGFAAPSGETPDRPAGHWAAEALNKWKDRGLLQGDETGDLRPDRPISRAEFAALVNRLLRLPEAGDSGFADVKPGAWYASDIAKAQAAGYLTGYPDHTARPLHPITREEAAVVLARVFQLEPEEDAAAPAFEDAEAIGAYARGAVAAMSGNGYLTGYKDGTFRSKRSITRAEAVSVMDRIAPRIVSEAGASELPEAEGNVLVNASGTVLRNTTIFGDLYLTEGIGEGDVALEGVTVTGTTFVLGGGENSLRLTDSKLNEIKVLKRNHKLRVLLQGTSTAGSVRANSGAILENGTDNGEAFGEVVISGSLPPEATVRLIGRFAKVGTEARPAGGEAITIVVDGTIDVLELNFRANLVVAAGGSVGTVKLGPTAAGSVLEGKVGAIDNAADGVTHDGQNVPKGASASETGADGGSGSGSSGSGGGSSSGVFRPAASRGTAAGTTKVASGVPAGRHLAILVSHSAIEAPPAGAAAPTGGTVMNPYSPGTDIGGVDAEINKYVGVYLLDASHKVVDFRQIELTEASIAPKRWNLVWNDEFDGPGIDETKWNFVEKGDGFGNGELQFYTRRPKNARVEQGALVIEAHKESYQDMNYTSAKLTTENKGRWTYGKYEIRAKLPEGRGLWPAIWMMPQDMDMYGTWPASGEIDIMELIGQEPGTAHGTLHYGNPHTSTGYSYALPEGESFADEYHTFAMEWEPGEMRWYVDGILYATQNDWFALGASQPVDYTYPAPFDRDFYMQLNVAVGGTWPGNPDDAIFAGERKMEVDYVRVYEMDSQYGYRKPAAERPGQRDQGGVTPPKAPLPDGNLIYNGGFDGSDPAAPGIEGVTGSDYWGFLVGFDGEATVQNDGGAMKVDVTNTGSANYSVQLVQQPVPLQFGETYKVSFDARAASADRPLAVKLGSGGDGGWKDYAEHSFNLNTSMTAYEFTFKMQAYTHNNARIELNFGGAVGPVWIDNVRVAKTDAEETDNRAPLTDGNYVYNGSFDLGKAGLAYWTWQTGASASAVAAAGTAAEGKPLVASISAGGNGSEAVQLTQSEIYLKRNAYYVVSFDGKSTVPSDIRLEVADAATGESYSGVRTIALTTELQRKQFYFYFDSPDDRKTKLRVLLGGSARTVTLDDFRIDERALAVVADEPVYIQAEHYFYQSGIRLEASGSGSNYADSFEVGDSLEYLIDVAQTGSYRLAYRVASGGGEIRLSSDGSVLGTTAIADTAGGWETCVSEPVSLSAGKQMIKLEAVSGEMKLSWLAIAAGEGDFPDDDAGNLIRNGQFNDGLEQWGFWTEAAAVPSNDAGKLKISVSNVGGQSWSVQATQSDVALEAGKYYTLSFDASASAPRKIGLAIERANNTGILPNRTIDLTTSTASFALEFGVGGAAEIGKLVFFLGNVGDAGAIGSHQIWIDNVKLRETNKAPSLSASVESGTAPGTTLIRATPDDGHHLAVSIGSSAVPVPNVGDRVPGTGNVVNPYASGDDLFGADASSNRYAAVYEANASNEIVRFKLFALTEQDIRAGEATEPAPELATSAIQPGGSHATTRISASVAPGHHLVAKVSHLPIPTPNVGSRAPTGGTVVNPYAAGTDLSGVDAETNKYVGLYEADAEHRIVGFKLIELGEPQVKSEQWQLVWSDEFEGPAIDGSKWNFVQGGGGYGNQELQNYTNRPENVRIENGELVLEARKENYEGSDYTSAKLETNNKAMWTYGRYEIRAQLPEGQGLWPAIWMMPHDMDVYGTWPASGEIDIMEALGHEPGTVHGTLHYGVEHANTGYSYTLPGGRKFTDDFHTFAVEWEPGELRFYADDILYAVQNDWFAYGYEHPDVYTYPAPFDRDFYMQLNVAVGGVWPGNPDASTVFPQRMKVDYVRVYQLDEANYRPVPGERPGPRDTSGIVGEAKAPTADGNYVYNGSFDQDDPAVEGIAGVAGTDYWTFVSGFGAQASVSNAGGKMKVDIANGGDATYAVQLIQKPIPLRTGKSYKVTLNARASANRSIEVKLSQGGEGGWTDYGKGGMAVTTEEGTYSYAFRMLSGTHYTARLEINLGGAAGSVWIDDVRFEEVTDDTAVERQPLGDGNYVYNGQFELGNNYLSYWTFETAGGAAAEAQVDRRIGHREFHAAIADGGASAEAVRLKQGGLPLEQGSWYKVAFRARAEAPRQIELAIAGKREDFALSTANAEYEFVFQMTDPDTLAGELAFLLGGDDADAYIDNVALKRYFPPLSVMRRAEQFETVNGAALKPKTGGGHYAAFADAGDFIEGAIDVAEAGEYIVSYKVSAIGAGKALNVALDEGAATALSVPATHGYEKWAVVTELVALSAGSHTWRLSGEGVNLDWIELAPNLVANAEMDAEEPWTLWVGTEDWAGNASASFGIENGEAVLDIGSVGSQFWSVQFNQIGAALKQGKQYRLSFDARSTVARQIRVAVEIDGGDPQYLLRTVDLGGGMTRYSFDFDMTRVSRDDVKINFIVGNVSGGVAPHRIYLDNVFLAETAETVPELGGGALENLALNRSATATSGNAQLAFDGNPATRWESAQSDPQSIRVDLGGVKEIDSVKLVWEAAYGKAYAIEVSEDGASWSTAFATHGGNGGTDEIRFVPVSARYVKLTGTARGTPYGYSLYEFAVYPHDPGYVVEPAAPPVLEADTTNAIIKRDAEIAFADDETWRNGIASVKVNGTALAYGTEYTVEDFAPTEPTRKKLVIKASAFPTAGDYVVTVESLRYQDAVVVQTISRIPPTTDLAAGRPAGAHTASSGNAAMAFDGNSGTRWESETSDPQWIQVDLGDTYEIGRIKLSWEGAYGKAYAVEVSEDGSHWQEVYATADGDGGIDTFSFPAVQARYVKLTGTVRINEAWSYSIWDFEVYPYDPSGLLTPPLLIADTTGNTIGQAVSVAFADDPAWRTAITDIRIDSVSVADSVYANAGTIDIPAALLPTAKDYEIRVVAVGYGDAVVIQPVLPINLAAGPGVTAEASSGEEAAELAIDGNPGTRWESVHGVDPQWITVNLGASYTISQLVIDWEGARASAYTVEVSVNGTDWEEAYSMTNPIGLKDTLIFAPVVARYVKITGTERAMPPYGYSIYEIAIY